MVALVEMSTLRNTRHEEINGHTLEDMVLSRDDYAWGGGGYPILIKNTGVVGSIAVSGLSGDEDHQIIVDALVEFKKTKKY
jgi:uncharacterized protein (UPF0303 family)